MSSHFAAAPWFLLVLVFAAFPAAGEGGGKTDDGKPHLTPFDWKKTALDAEEAAPAGKGPRLKRAKPDPAKDDELVCEKGVVHPTSVPGAWGVRRCWKKSDPHKIIERPFNFMTAEDMQDAAKSAARFPPLKKPRMPAAKTKPVKKTAPAAAPVAASAAAPDPDADADPDSPPATAKEDVSFPIVPPAAPLALKLSSAVVPEWGRTPRLRAIYYVAKDQTPNDLDRATIMRELKLIRDFYAHYGLAIEYEDRVYEVRGEAAKDLPAEQYDYYYIKKALERRGLLLPRRTIVFTTFDVGLGADMALTGLNDANTAKVECPREGKGNAWWCGRPESAHWGGSVHEVGHMLGLAHPSDFTREAPYRFSDGREYVFADDDAGKSVMKRHDRFFRHPDNGLLPHEIDALARRYGAGRPAAR